MSDSPLVVILAAGKSERFGQPKHLEVVAGETLLARQLRLWHEIDSRVMVVAPPESLDLFRSGAPARTTFVPRSAPVDTNAKKYREALNAAGDGAFVITFGDIFFTSRAIKRIHAGCAGDEIRLFCRFGPSAYTGKAYGEPFAVYLPVAQRKRFEDALEWVIAEHAAGRIQRDGLWEVAKHLEGIPAERFGEHMPLDMFVEIDDLTDDVDFPEDLDRLRAIIPSTMDEAIDGLSSVMGVARGLLASPLGAVPEPNLFRTFAFAMTEDVPSIPPLRARQSATLWVRWLAGKGLRGARRAARARRRAKRPRVLRRPASASEGA